MAEHGKHTLAEIKPYSRCLHVAASIAARITPFEYPRQILRRYTYARVGDNKNASARVYRYFPARRILERIGKRLFYRT